MLVGYTYTYFLNTAVAKIKDPHCKLNNYLTESNIKNHCGQFSLSNDWPQTTDQSYSDHA